jgi:hypothetical protein
MMTGFRAIGTPLPTSSLVERGGRGDCDPTIAVETSA